MPESLIGIRPIKDWVLVDIYDDGQKLIRVKGGGKIWLPPDDSFEKHSLKRTHEQRHPGIRARWAMVLAVNEEGESRGIKVGQKVLCDELKWTRGFEHDQKSHAKAWAIKAEDILMVDDDGFDEDEMEMITSKYGEIWIDGRP